MSFSFKKSAFAATLVAIFTSSCVLTRPETRGWEAVDANTRQLVPSERDRRVLGDLIDHADRATISTLKYKNAGISWAPNLEKLELDNGYDVIDGIMYTGVDTVSIAVSTRVKDMKYALRDLADKLYEDQGGSVFVIVGTPYANEKLHTFKIVRPQDLSAADQQKFAPLLTPKVLKRTDNTPHWRKTAYYSKTR